MILNLNNWIIYFEMSIMFTWQTSNIVLQSYIRLGFYIGRVLNWVQPVQWKMAVQTSICRLDENAWWLCMLQSPNAQCTLLFIHFLQLCHVTWCAQAVIETSKKIHWRRENINFTSSLSSCRKYMPYLHAHWRPFYYVLVHNPIQIACLFAMWITSG